MTPTIDSKNMTSPEVIKMMMPPPLHIEMRQKLNGDWLIFYPDPGFLPCSPVCAFGQRGMPLPTHKHEHEPKWIESEYKPTDRDDALAYSTLLAEGREVKVIEWVPPQQRRAQAAAAKG